MCSVVFIRILYCAYVRHNVLANLVYETYPNPSTNTDKFIRKTVCAKDKLIVAQKTMIMVIGIEIFRPFASIIIPNRNAPIAIPI